MSGQIVSFVNLKGGVGKTALAVNVGVSLAAELGQRVLIIDLDPQGNASLWLLGQKTWVGTVNHRKTKTVWGLLSRGTPVSQCIVKAPVREEAGHVVAENLDLIPATIHLMLFEEDYHHRDGRAPYYVKFYQEIEVLKKAYDFILLDCPPNVYKTTKCALFSADQIVVPCNTDSMSWMGLQLLAQRIKVFADRTMGQLEDSRPLAKAPLISALVLNNIQTTATAVLRRAEERLSTRLARLRGNGLVRDDAEVFSVKIRHAAAFHTGSFEFRPLLFMDNPSQPLLSDYRNLATLFLNRFGESYAGNS